MKKKLAILSITFEEGNDKISQQFWKYRVKSSLKRMNRQWKDVHSENGNWMQTRVQQKWSVSGISDLGQNGAIW